MTITLDNMLNGHRAAFPDAGPASLCRAPGRVNLIGEHLDYNGLPVLPMAIDRAIYLAFSPREDNLIQLRNQDRAFAPADFRNTAAIEPSQRGAWENYCKAAIVGLNAHFHPERYAGMDLYVDGDIPSGAGLSSSSALVVATTLAYLSVLGKKMEQDITRLELATLLAEAEQYVGTRGGGMDQAVILLGRRNHACMIHFFPLRVTHVPVFSDHAFVVCNSLVKAHKTGAMLERYNEGPLTCRLLRAVIEQQAREDYDDDLRIDRLADLWYGPLGLTHEEAAYLIERATPDEAVGLAWIAQRLGAPEETLRQDGFKELVEPPGGFLLRTRARHQITEHQRVEAARDCLLADDPEGFGAAMYHSHWSCAEDYRVSCPELDAMVHTAQAAGAMGARMTGAGFGGCTVNLVAPEQLGRFQETMHRQYYQNNGFPLDDIDSAFLPVRSADWADYMVQER